MASEKLGKFLTEVSNWKWDEFVNAERNKQFTSNQAIIFALIRACSMQKLSAIKLALNRLDGKLKTPVRIEMPKVFYLYPNATKNLNTTDAAPAEKLESPAPDPRQATALQVVEGEVLPAPIIEAPEAKDLPSMGLRETLTEMSDYPRDLPEAIVELADQTHQWIQGHAEKPAEIPMVKSVVAANLLLMAQNRNIDALTEVFDQIDGKLVETIQVLGEDLYINIYSDFAPDGAYLNKDGVLELEAEASQQIWATKLGKDLK